MWHIKIQQVVAESGKKPDQPLTKILKSSEVERD
jgi:hypothetical protein